MSRGYFITATDTGAGKTFFALALMQAFKISGLKVAGMKPVSAGCIQTADGLRNDDAEKLLQATSVPISYHTINPYAYEPAIAPHIAAQQIGEAIKIDTIYQHYERISAQVDCVIVEGAGGWQVPISAQQSLADVACALQLPVILVVAMRLGCINHALLTVSHIEAMGVQLAGWVANQVEGEMAAFEQNISFLKQKINAPLLGAIPHLPSSTTTALAAHSAVNHIDLAALKG